MFIAKLRMPVLPWRRVREEREGFRTQREGNDEPAESFLQRVPCGEPELALVVRRVVAECCGVPETLLHADDDTRRLERMFGATTFGEFVMAIPTALPEGVNSSDFWWALDAAVSHRRVPDWPLDEKTTGAAIDRWLAGETFGTWAAWVAGQIAERLNDRKSAVA